MLSILLHQIIETHDSIPKFKLSESQEFIYHKYSSIAAVNVLEHKRCEGFCLCNN